MTLSEEHRHFPHDRSWSCHVLAVERFIRNIAQPDVDCGASAAKSLASLPTVRSVDVGEHRSASPWLDQLKLVLVTELDVQADLVVQELNPATMTCR